MNQKLQASHNLFKKWTYFSFSQVLRPSATVHHSNCRQVSSIVETYSESDLSKNGRSILTNLLAGERWALARAITLIESTNKVQTLFSVLPMMIMVSRNQTDQNSCPYKDVFMLGQFFIFHYFKGQLSISNLSPPCPYPVIPSPRPKSTYCCLVK